MPADIDVLLGGSSPVPFSTNFQFNREFHDYDLSSEILNAENLNLSCATRNPRFDFSNAYGLSPNSTSYLSHSPPPTHFTFHGRCSSPTLLPVPSSPIALPKNFSQLRLAPSEGNKMPVAVPRRPCLVVRCDVLDLPTSSRSKKKVVFADDRGFPLTLVRTMTEPSNVPPQLSLQFLAKKNQETSKEIREPWEVAFSQPASDYLDFRNRLENNNVSLENVIVKEAEQVIMGTVKVRNLAFHKEVLIRTTSDNWKTQQDTFCTYVANNAACHGVSILYDTFSFRLPLPSTSRKIEFCVCYKCADTEFWDNNNGKNYSITKKESPDKRPSAESESVANKLINLSPKFRDDVKLNTHLESWSEFASWNHLNNTTPYW